RAQQRDAQPCVLRLPAAAVDGVGVEEQPDEVAADLVVVEVVARGGGGQVARERVGQVRQHRRGVEVAGVVADDDERRLQTLDVALALDRDAHLGGDDRLEDDALADPPDGAVPGPVVAVGRSSAHRAAPFRSFAVAARTSGRGAILMRKARTANRLDGIERFLPASIASSASPTSRSASSHSQSGIFEVQISARSWTSVRTQPGSSVSTRTPVPSSSGPRAAENVFTPALIAAELFCAMSPASDPTLMMTPCPRSAIAAAPRPPSTSTARTMTSSARRWTVRSRCAIGSWRPCPALLTSTSIGSESETSRCATRSVSSQSER